MGIQQWSEKVLVADLADDPLLTDDIDALLDDLQVRGDRHVVVDFSNVTFLNSSNIALLLKLRKYQAGRGRRLLLCGISPDVWSVFQVTGLEPLFEVCPEVSAGLTVLQIENPD